MFDIRRHAAECSTLLSCTLIVYNVLSVCQVCHQPCFVAHTAFMQKVFVSLGLLQ
jgi:hypothetical protein